MLDEAFIKKIKLTLRLFSLILIIQTIVIIHLRLKLSGLKEEVITKNLKVIDNQGNYRIVISNSIDSIKNRKRKDVISGMLFIDSNGIDKLSLGVSSKVSINGKIVNRIGNDNPLRLVINDDIGNERLGFGYFKLRDVVLLGMDGKNGQEGLYMFLAENELMGQKVGLFMSDQLSQQVIYLGRNIQGITMLNLDNPNKSRLSMSLDSHSKPSINYSKYSTSEEKELIK